MRSYEKYISEYVPGARKISLRSFREKWNHGNTKTNPTSYLINIDLIFNKNGVLLNCYHFEKKNIKQLFFFYNDSGQLLKVSTIDLTTHQLQMEENYTYDRQGRIEIETTTSYGYLMNLYSPTEIIHVYEDNKETVLMPGREMNKYEDEEDEEDEEKEDDHVIFRTYDENHLVIEEKCIRNKDELVSWVRNEYNESRELIRVVSLNEDEKEDGVTAYFPYEKGLETGFSYISDSNKYEWENFYSFNAKSHWIKKVRSSNGKQSIFSERKIEYYPEETRNTIPFTNIIIGERAPDITRANQKT